MASKVPSLEGSLYLRDPQSIIAYQLRKYFLTPKDTVPILPDLIISLPYRVAQFGKEPDNLVSNMQSDLQNMFSRIFVSDRNVQVSVTHSPNGDGTTDVTISVMYSLLSGELTQAGTTISLGADGRLQIPEDTIRPTLIS